jgi:predicted alpha/beta hydrolase
MAATELKIAASDGMPLAATRFDPPQASTATAPVTIISSAAAVRRGFYAPFATAIAERGSVVYTYDYRGVGGSLDRAIQQVDANMRSWGQRDARGVLEWVAAQHPGRSIHWVGQSYGGGFAIGLNRSNHLIARHLGIAVPHGWYRQMAGIEKLKVGLLMGAGVPLATALLGYLPGKRLGFGENLPKAAALEWRSWILSRNSMWDTIPPAELAPYTSFSAPMCFIRLTDDPWATEIATERMAAAFPAAQSKQIVALGPETTSGEPVGHLGFFRTRFKDTLWPHAFAWLEGSAAIYRSPPV